MGLDVSHDCWHGAYSAFSRWRQALGEAAGYEYAKDAVFGDTCKVFNVAMIDWAHLPDNCLQGEWPETPADPLLVLIAHSDCDGVIHPTQAGPLADRIEELLPLLPEGGGDGWDIRDWRKQTQAFIDGLRAAAEAGEDIEFA